MSVRRTEIRKARRKLLHSKTPDRERVAAYSFLMRELHAESIGNRLEAAKALQTWSYGVLFDDPIPDSAIERQARQAETLRGKKTKTPSPGSSV